MVDSFHFVPDWMYLLDMVLECLLYTQILKLSDLIGVSNVRDGWPIKIEQIIYLEGSFVA